MTLPLSLHDVFPFRQHPAYRELRDGRVLGACHFAEFFDELQVLVQVFALEARVDAAEIAIALASPAKCAKDCGRCFGVLILIPCRNLGGIDLKSM
jgi:hypothetical protein